MMQNRFFRAFSVKSFFYLWLSEIFTIFAFNFFNFYLILHVFALTKSNTAVSLVVISFTLPAIFFGAIAGVYVDRWNKKYVLLVSNIVRGILLITLAFFHQSLVFIYLTSFLVALVTQFFVPAEAPIIPLIVDGELLYSANALFGLGLYASVLLAYLLLGPIILIFGEINTLIILGVLFLLSSLLITAIRLQPKKQAKEKGVVHVSKKELLSEIRQALSIMRNSRQIYNSLVLLALAQILLLVLAVIAPGYATQVLHISIQKFPLFFIAPAALGVLVGGVILTTFLHQRSKEKLATLGLFLSGAAMLTLPYGSRIAAREIVHDVNNFLPHL
ncbi:MAG TPA: MFS transporter, partial [Patescibacteria group bacterium]|nr:MFS transporter [Patescibacteria group bacterium]